MKRISSPSVDCRTADDRALVVAVDGGDPVLPPCHFPRARLLEQLDLGAHTALTLVSAPAGWGKTTLLASWVVLGRSPHPVYWLTAPGDGGDVWQLLATRLTAEGLVAASAVDDPDGDPLARLNGVSEQVVVVVDEVVDSADARLVAGIETLTERGRGRIRLVVACRADPPLPLLRWHIRGLLSHITCERLSFTPGETRELFAAHGIELDERDLLALHSLAEGWPAALRLAALAMQGHPEPRRQMSGFALGNNAFADYVTREILGGLDPDLRTSLTRISVLDRMTPELVERLTGRTDSGPMLAQLERSNLFVVHCGGGQPWYRFHRLFGSLLHNELRRHEPRLHDELHREAARWYAEYRMPIDAIRHALAGRDWAHAAKVVGAHWRELLPGTRRAAVNGVAPSAPMAALEDPLLVLALAAERLEAGDLQVANTYLHLLERAGDQRMSEATGDLREAVAAFRVAVAIHSEDPSAMLDAVVVASSVTPCTGDGAALRSLVMLATGSAALYRGELLAAEPVLLGALRLAQQSTLTECRIFALRQLALLDVHRGALRTATLYANDLLAELDRRGLTCGGDDAVLTELLFAEISYQRHKLPAAEYHLERAIACGTTEQLVPTWFGNVVRAHVQAETGDPYSVIESLTADRQRVAEVLNLPLFTTALVATEVELLRITGRVAAGRRLVDQAFGPAGGAMWAQLLRAEVLLAERRPGAVVAALPVLDESTASLPAWSVAANLVHAHAMAAQGDRQEAGRALDRALAVVAEHGIRRAFTGRGRSMYDLLTTCLLPTSAHRRLADELVAELTAAQEPRTPEDRIPGFESLTERELVVLRYLQCVMSTAEIASVLFVSVNTVKTHLKSIYRKLGAGRRRDAVERARQLHLL